MELKEGRRPPDLMDTENMDLGQLDATVGEWEKAREWNDDASSMEVVADVVRKEAFKAHLEARRRIDIRRFTCTIVKSNGRYTTL